MIIGRVVRVGTQYVNKSYFLRHLAIWKKEKIAIIVQKCVLLFLFDPLLYIAINVKITSEIVCLVFVEVLRHWKVLQHENKLAGTT